MKIRRIPAAVALVAAGAIALSACSTPANDDSGNGSGSSSTGSTSAQTINVGWNEPLKSLNNVTSNGNSTANSNIVYLMRPLWNYYDADLKLAKNTDFGKYEVVSQDPLKVKYTIDSGAKWSDGVPVTAADMVLQWAGQSTHYNDAITQDAEGNNVIADGQVYFDSASAGIRQIEEFPEISEDGLTLTFTYSKPFADWENNFGAAISIGVPAHVTAQKALGMSDGKAAADALVKAFKDNDRATLAKIATFWNKGFDFVSLPSDPALYLSAGPYLMSEYVENQYITLKRNPDFTWGPKPKMDTITIRYNEDPMAQVQALQNGELDLIAPQSSADVLAALKGLSGTEVTTGPEGTYEHIDLTFNNGGPFDPATYGGDAEKAKLVRQAFLLTIPRDDILAKLIKPLQDDASVRNSFTAVPGSPNYDPIVAANNSDFYAKTDIEKAKSLLTQAGVTTPIDVRFLYGKSNVRRANQYQLIAESALKAGFTLVDNGDDKWGQRLGDGTYDATLFGWQSTSTAVTEPKANYVPKDQGGQNNYGGYDNPEVTALFNQLDTETDPAKQLTLLQGIEKHLWDDAFGVTIFQFPGVVAWNQKVEGVSTITISPTIFWNFWDWSIK